MSEPHLRKLRFNGKYKKYIQKTHNEANGECFSQTTNIRICTNIELLFQAKHSHQP